MILPNIERLCNAVAFVNGRGYLYGWLLNLACDTCSYGDGQLWGLLLPALPRCIINVSASSHNTHRHVAADLILCTHCVDYR